MRRSTITFATLLTAAATTAGLIPASPAMAATGDLVVNGVFRASGVKATVSVERYSDLAPSCYLAPPLPSSPPGDWRYEWNNYTDSKIVIYPSTDCTDPALTTVPAHGGSVETSRNARSFEVLT